MKDLIPENPHYYSGPLKALFTGGVPMIDVRAPVEFAQGSIPNAVNLPILDDSQRHEVGICYRERGREEAVELGQRLVSGQDRDAKIEGWLGEIERRPGTVIYCLRGGLRSRIAQGWLRREGLDVPIVDGGYKRLRNYLLENIEEQAGKSPFLVISGNTGSGKTEVLNRLSAAGFRAIDLEGLANHRGSAFGQTSTPQPCQADFENALSVQFIREEEKGSPFTLIEDESATIGRIVVPRAVYEKKKESSIFVLRVPRVERVALILRDYVETVWPAFKDLEDPYETFFDYYRLSFDRIRKRLGGALHHECLADLREAVGLQMEKGSFSGHTVWIEKLLINYYDPLYEKGLARKRELIIGEGGESDLTQLLERGGYHPGETGESDEKRAALFDIRAAQF